MKKLFLLFTSLILVLGVSAQNVYEISVSSFNFKINNDGTAYQAEMPFKYIGAEIEGEPFDWEAAGYEEFPAEMVTLVKGDIVKVNVDGKFSEEIETLGFVLYDHSGAANYYFQLTEFGENEFEVNSDEVNQSFSVPVAEDALGAGDYQVILTASLVDGVDVVKFNKTGETINNYSCTIAENISLSENNDHDGYQGEVIVSELADKDINAGDEISINIKGNCPELAGKDVIVVFVDAAKSVGYWHDMSGWNNTIKVGEDGVIDATAVISTTQASVDRNAKEANDVYKVILAVKPYVSGVTSYEITIDESQKPEVTSIIVKANSWADGSNFQYTQDFDQALAVGDVVKVKLNGTIDNLVNLQMTVISNSTYAAITEYKQVNFSDDQAASENIDVDFEFEITEAVAAGVGALSITSIEPSDGADFKNVTISVNEFAVSVVPAGTSTDPEQPGTCIEEVAFGVNNGIIASEGTINVFNVLGVKVLSVEKELNVQSLGEGVFIISAKEGAFKFAK